MLLRPLFSFLFSTHIEKLFRSFKIIPKVEPNVGIFISNQLMFKSYIYQPSFSEIIDENSLINDTVVSS